MGVAIYMAHLEHPFRDPAGGPGWELAGLYLAAFITLLLTGAGKISIDGLRKDAPPATDPAQPAPFPAYEVSKPAANPPAANPPAANPDQPVQGGDGVWDGKE